MLRAWSQGGRVGGKKLGLGESLLSLLTLGLPVWPPVTVMCIKDESHSEAGFLILPSHKAQ